MANTVWSIFIYRIAMLHIFISTVSAFKNRVNCFRKMERISRHFSASSVSSTYTIKEPIEVTEIVKKSRFIGKVSPFKSIEDALSIVKQLSEPKATHNCWAFRSSSIPTYERSSDDGEPGGTAGRPILSALESEGDYFSSVI